MMLRDYQDDVSNLVSDICKSTAGWIPLTFFPLPPCPLHYLLSSCQSCLKALPPSFASERHGEKAKHRRLERSVHPRQERNAAFIWLSSTPFHSNSRKCPCCRPYDAHAHHVNSEIADPIFWSLREGTTLHE